MLSTLNRQKHLHFNYNIPHITHSRSVINSFGRFQTNTEHDRRLYKYLSEPTQHVRIPRFYGIPKIQKQFTTFPPLRPQTASILSPSAHFIDHILQPVAQTYPDYLSIALQDLHVPDEATLVTVDVASLYLYSRSYVTVYAKTNHMSAKFF